MVMPSLLSQFVPNVSSSAKTDFIRCWAVALGGAGRKMECWGGAETRALAGGGMLTAGRVCAPAGDTVTGV